MQIEDFASRDRMRFAATVSLVYGTSEEQVRRIVTGVEAMLRANPKVWPDTVVAKLLAFSPSSLDVEVLCWFAPSDYGEFRELRQEALLGIMRIVAEAGRASPSRRRPSTWWRRRVDQGRSRVPRRLELDSARRRGAASAQPAGGPTMPESPAPDPVAEQSTLDCDNPGSSAPGSFGRCEPCTASARGPLSR
jgi:hypothetical protein